MFTLFLRKKIDQHHSTFLRIKVLKNVVLKLAFKTKNQLEGIKKA